MTPTTALGPLGIATGPAPADAAALEDAGARTLWLAGGAIDRLDRLTALLDGTRDAVVVPGIVPTGVYPAAAVAAVHADAARRRPRRYLTGLGAPPQPRALDALHRHLDELDALGLPDAVSARAGVADIAARVAEHRAAGADHVVLSPVGHPTAGAELLRALRADRR
ncbi:hypothetical protein [Pseudonocardia spirodelae]|uniref:LLM class flavin-dependent oxidoreductase n=1 Tax=Pseudonocardia spirodelae TaxID=3133431 RepID=A0ABU8TDZ1_9PSEU